MEASKWDLKPQMPNFDIWSISLLLWYGAGRGTESYTAVLHIRLEAPNCVNWTYLLFTGGMEIVDKIDLDACGYDLKQ